MNSDLKSRMARYEQELLQMRSRSQAATPTAAVVDSPSRFSTLQVQVVDDKTNQPLTGAVVMVLEGERDGNDREIVFIRVTDNDGKIEPLPLEVDRDDVYEVIAAIPGYYRSTESNIAANGQPITLTLRMRALPEL